MPVINSVKLLIILSWVLGMNRMNSIPRTGRKVINDKIGKFPIYLPENFKLK
jgi:hypothetical protein